MYLYVTFLPKIIKNIVKKKASNASFDLGEGVCMALQACDGSMQQGPKHKPHGDVEPVNFTSLISEHW